MNGANTPNRSSNVSNAYSPAMVKIEIGGQQMDQQFIEDVLDVTVEESLHLPSICTLMINNDYFPGRQQDPPWKHEEKFRIGKSLKVSFKNSTTNYFNQEHNEVIFEGEITGIEAHFTDQSQAPTLIRAYDISHRLHRGRYNRSFLNMTDTEIVKKIAQEVKIQQVDADDSGLNHEYVFQENQTNMEFLRQRAFRLGYELFVQNSKLYFRKPKVGETLNLKWLRDFNSFHVRVSSAEQVQNVEVRGWNYEDKKEIVETAQTEQVLTEIAETAHPQELQQGQRGDSQTQPFYLPQSSQSNGAGSRNTSGTGKRRGSQISTRFQTQPKMIVVDQPVFTSAEARQMAQAICNELGGEFVWADARAEGNPQIRVGKVAQLQSMGPYDGQYYITEVRHVYRKRVYKTEFTVRGLRGGHLMTQLAPQNHLEPGQTFLVGIVTDNKDPKGWGRVKVKFPTLTMDHSSNWARVVGLGAADNRGFYCLPEINDEVLVGFEHGDIHRPYVLGGVWNGKDDTPDSVDDTIQSNKVRLRTVKTRTGHVVQFIEEPKGSSKAGIIITTSGGHQIYLNDSDRKIVIESKGGHRLEMNDSNQSVTLSSTGNMTIKANGTISIEAAMIKLN